jgi:predicted ATPase
MNIIASLTARIEEYRAENKQPCKNYASEAAAEKAAAKMAQIAATHFDRQGRADAPPAQYVVFYIAAWGRWVACINMSELMNRSSSTGGYIGICKGFFTF